MSVQRARGSVGLRRAPVPAQHVPDVFVTAAGESRSVARQYVAQKLAEGAFPALRAVQAAEGAQGVDEVGGSAAGSLLSRALSHRPSLPLGSWCSSTMPAIPDAGVVLTLVPPPRTMSDGLQILRHALR